MTTTSAHGEKGKTMRLIDADALKVYEVPLKNEWHFTEITKVVFAEDILDAPSIDIPQWIPCSERLPHAEYGESDNVLTCTEDGLYRILYFDGGNWCYPTGETFEHSTHKVIAWMPLPEPYKEKNDD